LIVEAGDGERLIAPRYGGEGLADTNSSDFLE
jgi:hypothetical protein